MSQVKLTVTLTVPEGSGYELTADQYAGLVEQALIEWHEDGRLSGVAQVEVDPEDE